MPAFGPVQPLTLTRLGLELVDARTLSEEDEWRTRELWHNGMKALLQRESTFTPTDTCIDEQNCYGPLISAYLDHVERERAAGRDGGLYLDFSRDNFDRVGIPDYFCKPHLPVHWFAIRQPGQSTIVGSLNICNIEPVKQESRLLTLRGWPGAVVPARGNLDPATLNGSVCRSVMDNDLITADGEPNVDFVEWVLPQHPDARYVERGTNTYGRDVFEAMADGVRVRFDSTTTAPREIKRELQPTDDVREYQDYTRPTRAEPVIGISTPPTRG